MASLDVPPLSGSLVRIEPLTAAHVPDLAEAAEENRGSYGFTWVPRAAPGEEGKLRDSALFSVIADEWLTVKSALAARVVKASELRLV